MRKSVAERSVILLTVGGVLLYNFHDASYARHFTVGMIEERKVSLEHHAHIVTSYSAVSD